MKCAISGNQQDGTYAVECECGDSWTGRGEYCGAFLYSPCLPIAESVVHWRLVHSTGPRIDVIFSGPFANWLQRYWEDSASREFQAAESGRVEKM